MDHAHATTIVYIPGKKEKASTKKEADISVFVNEDITNLTIRRNKPKDLKATCTFEKAEVRKNNVAFALKHFVKSITFLVD